MRNSLASIPAARRTDPQTSHIAVREVTLSGRRETQADVFLRIVREHPGETSTELADLSERYDRYVAARRLPELEKLGMVRKGDSRRCRLTGNEEVTWWPIRQRLL